ncbi:hypothetical protein SNEBB_000755, partial [Seison nebaliae]
MTNFMFLPLHFLVVWLKRVYINWIVHSNPPPTECYYPVINSVIPKIIWDRKCRALFAAKYSTSVFFISLTVNILFWLALFWVSRHLYRKSISRAISNEDEKNEDSSINQPNSLSYMGELANNIVSRSSNIRNKNSGDRVMDSKTSLSSTSILKMMLNFGKLKPVEVSNEHVAPLLVGNQQTERCQSDFLNNSTERTAIHINRSWMEFGGNILSSISPILLDRKSRQETGEQLNNRETSRSRECSDQSNGDQIHEKNVAFMWDSDESSTFSTEISSSYSNISQTCGEPLGQSIKNLLEHVNYPLEGCDPELIASFINRHNDTDTAPRGYPIRQQSQENASSSQTSSSEK